MTGRFDILIFEKIAKKKIEVKLGPKKALFLEVLSNIYQKLRFSVPVTLF